MKNMTEKHTNSTEELKEKAENISEKLGKKSDTYKIGAEG